MCPCLCGSSSVVEPAPVEAEVQRGVRFTVPASEASSAASSDRPSGSKIAGRRASWRPSWSLSKPRTSGDVEASTGPVGDMMGQRKSSISGLDMASKMKLRQSTVDDKKRMAADAARGGGIKQADQDLLLDSVRDAFDEVAGTECDKVSREQYDDIFKLVLQEMERSDLAGDTLSFIFLELSGAGAEASVEEFAAYVRRFESWAEQRKLLRDSKVDVDTPSLTLEGPFTGEGPDPVVLAACSHCLSLTSVSVKHGKLHNSTLSTLAQAVNGKLTFLDLTCTGGFSDLGLKALAAHCLELRTLRIAGCAVTADGLTPVVKFCTKLESIECTESKRLDASLAFASKGCDIRRIPIDQLSGATSS